jgi:isocitrate lyase
MRSTPLYAPDGMTGAGRYAEHFDDGLVHNHHWAVTTDEAYPSQGSAVESGRGTGFAGASAIQSRGEATYADDRHDDGLVHNHDWAVTGK